MIRFLRRAVTTRGTARVGLDGVVTARDAFGLDGVMTARDAFGLVTSTFRAWVRTGASVTRGAVVPLPGTTAPEPTMSAMICVVRVPEHEVLAVGAELRRRQAQGAHRRVHLAARRARRLEPCTSRLQ
jgi:hypothetical protein